MKMNTSAQKENIYSCFISFLFPYSEKNKKQTNKPHWFEFLYIFFVFLLKIVLWYKTYIIKFTVIIAFKCIV